MGVRAVEKWGTVEILLGTDPRGFRLETEGWKSLELKKSYEKVTRKVPHLGFGEKYPL